MSIGGAVVGFMVGGPMGAQIGFVGGTVLGSMIFPMKSKVEMPKVGEYPIQRSNKGIPIPPIYGTVRMAGNILWMGKLISYTIKHSASGGKGGGDEAVTEETKYKRSFLIGICEGPALVRRCWKGKKSIGTSKFTQFSGDDNSGISALIGENYAEYKNMCCVYFEKYKLGRSQALPNFVFEVVKGRFEDTFLLIKGTATGTVIVEKLIDHNDGTFSEVVGGFGFGSNGPAALGYDGNKYFYYCTQHALHKKNVADFTAVTEWQSSGSKTYSNINRSVLDVDRITGNVLVCVHDQMKLLDSDGDEIWSENQGINTDWHNARFTASGDIIGVRHPNGGDTLGFRISKVDGSILFSYGTLALNGDNPTDIVEDPDTLAVIIVGRYQGDHVVISWSKTGGGVGDELWINTLAIAVGQLNCIFRDSANGALFVGGYPSTSPEGNVHKYSAAGDWQKGYNLNNIINDINLRNFDEIVVTGYTATDDDGNIADLWILDRSLKYQRSYEYGGSVVRIAAFAFPLEPSTDENCALVIKDLLTNTRYGAGLDESTYLNTDTFNAVASYCASNNLNISLVIDTQKPLWDWVDYICSHFGGFRYRSGGKICLGVFSEADSAFALTRDNLVVPGDDATPPVSIKKRKYTETYNRIEIQWTDRDADYDTSIAIASDEVDQRISGQMRKNTIDLAGITDPTYAQRMAYRMLIESMYRHSMYSFTLAYKNMLLEVNDVGSLTDGFLLTDEKIRITSVSEAQDGKGLFIEAVEDGSGLYPDIAFASQQTEWTPPETPVLSNARIVFRENIFLPYLHLSFVPGNENVSGYNIYRSYDAASYTFVGRSTLDGITGEDSNSYGTLESSLPAYPAVVYRKDEKLLVDIGTLTDLDTAIADATFFNGLKILRIGDEIIGYHSCVETFAAGVWEVTGLIRGLDNTLPTIHSPGDAVETLDIDFTYILNETDIGRTVYFKTVVFYGNDFQDVSDATAYSHSVLGKSLKPLPVSLIRIRNREGLTTYKTDDVIIDWYFCSRTSGFGRGGYGNALWGAFAFDISIKTMNAILKEIDDTEILNLILDISSVGLPMSLLIEDADRGGNNPYKVELTPGSTLKALGGREIQVEQL